MTEHSESRKDGSTSGNVTNYLANERTYLAWLRTGIATIGLGFVVARFGLVIRELTGISAIPETKFHLSSFIGIALSVVGGAMVLFAFNRYAKNQERIRAGSFEPSTKAELVVSTTIFATALLVILYLLLTF